MKIYSSENSCLMMMYSNSVKGMPTFEVPDSLWEEYQILKEKIEEIESQFDKLEAAQNE